MTTPLSWITSRRLVCVVCERPRAWQVVLLGASPRLINREGAPTSVRLRKRAPYGRPSVCVARALGPQRNRQPVVRAPLSMAFEVGDNARAAHVDLILADPKKTDR